MAQGRLDSPEEGKAHADRIRAGQPDIATGKHTLVEDKAGNQVEKVPACIRAEPGDTDNSREVGQDGFLRFLPWLFRLFCHHFWF